MKRKTAVFSGILIALYCFDFSAKGENLKESVEHEASQDESWSFEDSPLYEDELDGVYDPLEPWNRLMFGVNNVIDKVFLAPLAVAYKHIIPNFLQIGFSNFVTNFFAPVRIINFILQGDGEYVAKTAFRFVVNTIIGVLGMIDVASKMGVDHKDTSLGKTFKKWGMKQGPYLVLPILGCGSMRSGFGDILQIPAEPAAQVSLLRWRKNTRDKIFYSIYGAKAVIKRSEILEAVRELELTSSDMYITTRNVIMGTE